MQTRDRQAQDRLSVVRALLSCQFLMCLILGAVGLLWGHIAAVSLFLGGMICLVPNLYFAWKAFRFSGARAARAIVRSFYQGETIKFLLTAALFALVFVYVRPLEPLALFTGFILVQATGWLTPLVFQYGRTRGASR